MGAVKAGPVAPRGIAAACAVTAAGLGVPALWRAVIESRSGLQQGAVDWAPKQTWLGAAASTGTGAEDSHGDAIGVEPAAPDCRLGDWDCRNHRLARLALAQDGFGGAVARARERLGAARIGVVVGTSTSGIESTEQAYAQRRAQGHWPADFSYRRVHSAEALPRFVAQHLGLTGPLMAVCTACSSSAKAFIVAQRWIDAGIVDAVVVGGADSLCRSTLQGFGSLQLLADEPCRPFDAARRGISLGEAAGFVLLTREPGEFNLVGGGESSDAWHMSTPHPQGRGAAAAMQAALAQAGLAPDAIGYVNAHGTGTAANDRAEAQAIATVFGPQGVPASSTKGVTGHTLGAAGIVEALVALQALAQRQAPATTHLREPEDGLPVDLLRSPRAFASRWALSNNFGFGGSNCALVFARA